MKNKILFILIIFGVLTGAWWLFIKDKSFRQPVFKSASGYLVYQNNKGRYEMEIPDGWEITESTEGGKFTTRTVWQIKTGGLPLGSISQISVTVIASSSAGQPLSTQKEFEDWIIKDNGSADSDSGIIKVGNEVISGIKSVTLKEEAIINGDNQNSYFSQTSWFIKDNTNYYINVMGNGLFTDSEKRYFDRILKSFQLQ